MKLKQQITDLKILFETNDIFINGKKRDLTQQEETEIIKKISTCKTDGKYEINDKLSLEFINGEVIIIFNE